MAPIRQKHDTATKVNVVEQVLAQKVTVEQACKKHDLQPGQLYAWIGQYALQKAVREARNPSASVPQNSSLDTTQKLRALASSLPEVPNDDPGLVAAIERAVGRYVIDKRRDGQD